MIRRFNYTGRKRIPRSKISLSLNEVPGRKLAFDAFIDFVGIPLPATAKIYIEAYRKTYFRRFQCGTISTPAYQVNQILEGLDPDALVLFRVKVVDKKGRLLAIADRIRPRRTEEDQTDRQSLLPVEFIDLGESIWHLDLEGDLPILQLNKRIENIKDIARHDTFFLTLVYPEVVRQILYKVVIEEDYTDMEAEGEEEWMIDWLKFAVQILGKNHLPPTGSSESIKQEKLKWLDDVVNAFCVNNAVLEKYMKEQKIGEP
ncbi:MAG: hypothetical protein JW944_09120 [Deltaproteobacteria bacterium]|nr:hypothetical protein [Deltaproteobacteria bacterium]